jgi:hypothetical protein
MKIFDASPYLVIAIQKAKFISVMAKIGTQKFREGDHKIQLTCEVQLPIGQWSVDESSWLALRQQSCQASSWPQQLSSETDDSLKAPSTCSSS